MYSVGEIWTIVSKVYKKIQRISNSHNNLEKRKQYWRTYTNKRLTNL